MKYPCHNLIETEKVAKDFLAGLKKGKTATIVGLQGNLGSGKTAFTQLVAKNLGIKQALTSPTFVLEKKYEIPQSGISACEVLLRPSVALCEGGAKKAKSPTERLSSQYSQLIHIDAYRLKSGQDLLRLDWAEISADPNNLILVEWPEIIADIWQPDFKILYFEFIDEKTREITL